MLFDLVCDCVLERFLTKKSNLLEKLANSRYVFEIQPTGTGSIIISILHECWLFAANVKETTVKSTGNAGSM